MRRIRMPGLADPTADRVDRMAGLPVADAALPLRVVVAADAAAAVAVVLRAAVVADAAAAVVVVADLAEVDVGAPVARNTA